MAYSWDTTKKNLSIVNVSGSDYYLKDAEAREAIDKLSGYTEFLGVTTTDVTTVAGSSSATVEIGGKSVTAKKGDIVIYGQGEFIWDGSVWAEFGDLSGIYDELGDLAFNDEASADYTPAGTIVSSGSYVGSQATITVSGSTTGGIAIVASSESGNYTPAGSVNVVLASGTQNVVYSAAQGTLPTFSASLLTATVSSETLTFTLEANGFDAGTLPTFSTSDVLNSVSVSSQTFTGTKADIKFDPSSVSLEGTYTPVLSSVPTYTFSGTSASIVVSGSVSKPTT